MTNRGTLASALTMLLSASTLSAQHVPARSSTAVGKTVALTPGTCPQVADGDSITFEWNPAFDNAAVVTGLQNMVLMFSRPGEEGATRRRYAGFVLTAFPHISPELAPFPDAVVPAPNGFYKVHFRVILSNAQPGEYRLIDARAEPQVDPSYDGKKPEMTNNPVQSPFCLTVMAPPVAPAATTP